MTQTAPTIQIISGPDFLDQIKETVREESFMETLEMTGLADLPIDKNSVMYLLGVTTHSTIDRYVEIGKVDRFNQRHFLDRHFPDGNNKPRFILKEVLLFKRKF